MISDGMGCRRFVAFLLAACLCLLAQAASEPAPAWPGVQVPATYWVDDSGQLSLDEVLPRFQHGDARPVDPDKTLPTGEGHAVWYQLQLPDVSSPRAAILTVPHPGMDGVDLYRPDSAGGWQVERAGDMVPVARWPVRYLHPAFKFVLQPDETRPTYLRVQHSHPIGVRWLLWDAHSFDESSKLWHMLLGGYVGFIVLVVVLSCTNAVSWRDPIHLYYAAYVVVLGLGQLSLTGLAGEYFWPHNAWWNDIASVVLPMMAAVLASLLLRELVAERGSRLLTRLLLSAGIAGALISLGFLVVGRDPFFLLSNIFYLLTFVLTLGTLGWFAWRRPRVGLWVLAGFLMLIVGSMFSILRNLSVLPMTFATQFGAQIGAALEIPLLLTGLYFRSRERRDNQVRLGALSRVDPLTGVATHRVLVERLEHLLQRHHRDPTIGAVLRVRVSNGPAIRQEHGLEGAQAALVKAGACVARCASEGDTVARHRDGDFVLILEGRVTRDQASEVGQSIIARGLAYSRRLPPGVTLALHVAYACAPLPGDNAEELLDRLDETLDEIAQHPARALRFAGEAAQVVMLHRA
ncbi:sensor domain-containing diguanylate cyclase [Variovorax terrae]|uniref:Diguanylate cyclase n=1 Tax=Variovorax terrae TaxID=2923278 RepID=A0A9X1VXL8_9BURK|nr:7TM diverse intracellular signaling domain-containing protein [Variovorax terrae]MCJ0765163.1 diguanylate cyclase [Variovorax terrae]